MKGRRRQYSAKGGNAIDGDDGGGETGRGSGETAPKIKDEGRVETNSLLRYLDFARGRKTYVFVKRLVRRVKAL